MFVKDMHSDCNRFNLSRALNGEPVKLRNGLKAYVKYVMPDQYTGSNPLRGYYIDYTISCNPIREYCWDIYGRSPGYSFQSERDIVGMWKEEKEVTITLPVPLRCPLPDMWYVRNGNVYKSNATPPFYHDLNVELFNNGCYFASEESAKKYADAMKRVKEYND